MKASSIDSPQMSLAQAIEISQEFGRFLSKGQPLVLDAQLLPHHKSTIGPALLTYEQHLCDAANRHIVFGRKVELKNTEQILGPLQSCRGLLNAYSDIDPEDAEIVSYFNSFATMKDVPTDELERCFDLHMKYASRGFERA